MSSATAMILVLSAAVVAFSLRASMIFALGGVEIPGWAQRWLSYIGPAVLAAMTVNFAFGGEGGPFFTLPTVTTMLVAVVVAVWKRNLVLTLAVAMPVLWVTTAWWG